MRKLTKGFLIFGVATHYRLYPALCRIQSDGIKSLLAMSMVSVYDSRMEELTLRVVENLEITLHQHALTTTDSFSMIKSITSLTIHISILTMDLITNQR